MIFDTAYKLELDTFAMARKLSLLGLWETAKFFSAVVYNDFEMIRAHGSVSMSCTGEYTTIRLGTLILFWHQLDV